MGVLLDDFNRADNTDPGANWIQQIHSAYPQSHDIVSNQCKAATSGWCSDYWFQTYDQDQDAWCTIVQMPTTGAFRVVARIENPQTASPTAYEFEIDASNSYLVRVDAPDYARTTLDVGGVGFANGDGIKIKCEADTITGYRDAGAGWVELCQVTGETYIPATSYIGIITTNDTGLIIDDFGGGNLGSPETQSFYISRRRTVSR